MLLLIFFLDLSFLNGVLYFIITEVFWEFGIKFKGKGLLYLFLGMYFVLKKVVCFDIYF